MKTLTSLSIGTALIAGAYLVYAAPVMYPPAPAHQSVQTKTQKPKPPTTAMCQAVMDKRTKSMEDIKNMDSAMDGLLARVDFATGEERVNAIATALRELVRQRAAMRAATTSMETDLMSHMMMHIKSGTMDCPVIKSMTTPQ